MKQKVKNFIEKNHLLQPGACVVVGLSGGADSVVLLSILHDLGYDCIAAHCNFRLRGEEADRDERLAADYAESLNIPVFRSSFDTRLIAAERKISIEMAARDLRYEWFEILRKEQAAEAIAVAHHRDDSIETMLLNLIRGTGIRGLTGIQPKKDSVIRPLLDVSKEEIMRYVVDNELPFVVDSSNLDDEFTRNKIRLHLLPFLRSINPGIELSLERTMEHLGEVYKIYENHIRETRTDVFDEQTGAINLSRLLRYPSPESILFELLKDYGFNKEVIKDIYQSVESQPGKVFFSDEYRLVKDRNHFLLKPQKEKETASVFYIHETDREIQSPFFMRITIREKENDFIPPKEQSLASFDAAKLKFPLILRKWQPGDRFVPFGMSGSQKLSDYFSDHKFTQPEKENTWVLCSGNQICWIVGHRIDNRFRVEKNSHTICILQIG